MLNNRDMSVTSLLTPSITSQVDSLRTIILSFGIIAKTLFSRLGFKGPYVGLNRNAARKGIYLRGAKFLYSLNFPREISYDRNVDKIGNHRLNGSSVAFIDRKKE